MKTNLKRCDGCEEHRRIWKNVTEDGERKRYCKGCWSARKSKKHKPTPTNKKPIRSRSSRRQKDEAEYSKKAKRFKEANPLCQACIPGICGTFATDVHHKGGRVEDDLLAEEDWLAVCRPCHEWIEGHPKEARDLGYSISKTK